MSEYRLLTSTQAHGPVEVVMGYREYPAVGFFTVVERVDHAAQGRCLYSSLEDEEMRDRMGLSMMMEPYQAKLKELGIRLPPAMEAQVLLDGLFNLTGRRCLYDDNGTLLSRAASVQGDRYRPTLRE